MFVKKSRDLGHDFSGKKQPGLDCSDRETSEHHVDLFADQFGADRLDFRNDTGRFRDYAGDRGQSVDAKRAERFEVGLNAGAGAAVGTGDGEGDSKFSERFHGNIAGSGKSILQKWRVAATSGDLDCRRQK